jgi:hypothetical protein
MSQLHLSGYDDLVLIGFGSLGEVWQACRRGSGETVVLRRVVGASKFALAATREQCVTVRSLPSDHAVTVRTTTRSGEDDVLVLDHAAGGSLSALLAERPALSAGEVVTVIGPLAELLAQAHEAGIVHGRIDLTSVLLDRAGRPLLDGLGLLPLHDPADCHDPTGALRAAADVWALGALGARLLTGQSATKGPLSAQAPTAPVPLVRALEAALAFDPTQRPSAAELAKAVLGACPAAPLGRRSGVQDVADAPRRRRPSARPFAAAAAIALVLSTVVSVGWAWGRDGVARAGRAAPSWASVLQALDAQRGEAFAQGNPRLLDRVYLPGAPALSADRAALAQLARQGTTAVGLRHLVQATAVVRSTDVLVELDVVEQLAAYALRSARGSVPHAAGPAVRHRMVLRHAAVGWRVAQILTA